MPTKANRKTTTKAKKHTTRTPAKKTAGAAIVNARRVGPETLARAAWARGEGFWKSMQAEGERLRGASRTSGADAAAHPVH